MLIKKGLFCKVIDVLHGLNLDLCIFIDNAPFHLYGYLDNVVPIIPYYGENEDTELLNLLTFLKQIKSEPNYIPILREQFRMKNYRRFKDFYDFALSMVIE